MTNTIDCIECAAPLNLGTPEPGEVLDCDDCGAELEVVSINPIQIAIAPEIGEDWGE